LDEVGRKTRELALRLPAAPGVYRFSDAAGVRRGGRPLVAATPPEWAGFARRNAELAARLVSPLNSTGRNDRDGRS
jgi:hypothetical protein